MELNFTKGYVTFADILGWKGIWQSKTNGNPVNNLIDINKSMNMSIEKFQRKHFEYLINNELKPILTDDLRKVMLNKITRTESEILEIINSSFATGNEKDLHKIKIEKDQFQNEYNKFEISISIDLISDTFIITSSGGNEVHELFLHSLISQRLIIECLRKGLLIRGSTSHGEYYKKELVFVGAAIDDSASWHEMGEEIGIFLSPKALFTIESVNFEMEEIEINDQKLSDVMFKCIPKLKVHTFETYMIKWFSGEKDFNKIISEYSTILPDIHKKILFSKNRLQENSVKPL